MFLVVVLRSPRRSSSDLGEAAFLVVVARLLESMLGIFWTAGVGTLPFLVLGLMVGDEDEEVGVARRGRARPRSTGDRADRRGAPSPDCGCCASTTRRSWARGVAATASCGALGVDVVLVSPRRWNEGGRDVDLDLDGRPVRGGGGHGREPPLRVRVRPAPDLAGAAVARPST